MNSPSIIRNVFLERIKSIFEVITIEGHLKGSMARGNTDEYSDIDIWLTFKDEDFEMVKERRLEYYANIGEILHINEAPQNRPPNGIFSSVIYKTESGLLVVDYVLCPLSTSYRTEDYKYLFGDVELLFGQFEYNQEKVSLPDTYRLDFFISILNGSIKKLMRKNENSLEFLINEYQNLKDKYNIPVETLTNTENTFETLYEIIQKVKFVATDKQKEVLVGIENFTEKVRRNNSV